MFRPNGPISDKMSLITKVFGTYSDRQIKKIKPLLYQVNALSDKYKAMSDADTSDSSITDDNMLMERMGIPVYMTDLGATNIKITYSDDILLAEYLLEKSNG